jgi:hypothetical protein
MVGLIILAVAILASLVWLWAGGIDYMNRNHSEYKGEDFLSWDDKIEDYEIDPYDTPERKDNKNKTS